MIRTLFYLGFFPKKHLDTSANFRYKNSGWTLLEVMIVIVIIGILASLAIPNMMGAIEKRKAQSALFQIKGTLQEAQRNAIKMGKECRVTLKGTNDDFDPPSIAVNSDPEYVGCLSSSETFFEGLEMRENFSGNNIRFSYRGNTTNIATIVVKSPSAETQYCLVVSNFLGIMRSGVYDESRTSDKCQSSF